LRLRIIRWGFLRLILRKSSLSAPPILLENVLDPLRTLTRVAEFKVLPKSVIAVVLYSEAAIALAVVDELKGKVNVECMGRKWMAHRSLMDALC
jgi:hypothetical protein